MKTLKKYVSEKSSKSNYFSKIIRYYKKEDLIKIALFCVEDCLHLSSSQQDMKDCIDIIKKWLKDPFSVKRKELKDVANKTYRNSIDSPSLAAVYMIDSIFSKLIVSAINSVAQVASRSFRNGKGGKEQRFNLYVNYARLFAYEDLSFPYKDFARTFNLDNLTDLNIFLDFLTDNYPEAITYPREEYFTNKLAKEYLRVIYQ